MILSSKSFHTSERAIPARLIVLDGEKGPVVAPQGISYRTQPGVFIGRDGKDYVVKSDNLTTVIAETLGYGLAELVHLPVPPWALTRLKSPPGFGFCSEYQERTDVLRYLERGRIVNKWIVAETLVFDLWVANEDRNTMAFVGRIPEAGDSGQLEALAIDFELSHLLRGMSPIQVNMLQLRPRQEVRRFVPKEGDPFAVMANRIASLTEKQISTAFDRLRFPGEGMFPALYPSSWADTAIRALLHRASRIHVLVTEVLRAN